jgi:hypothetical protein
MRAGASLAIAVRDWRFWLGIVTCAALLWSGGGRTWSRFK